MRRQRRARAPQTPRERYNSNDRRDVILHVQAQFAYECPYVMVRFFGCEIPLDLQDHNIYQYQGGAATYVRHVYRVTATQWDQIIHNLDNVNGNWAEYTNNQLPPTAQQQWTFDIIGHRQTDWLAQRPTTVIRYSYQGNGFS